LTETLPPDPLSQSEEACGAGDPRESVALPELRSTPHAPPRPRLARSDDARAYARLLVSDIRLYHDMDVVAGRAAGDLASRLEAPLRMARARYLARFTDPSAFDREVVSVLAAGDPRRLGR